MIISLTAGCGGSTNDTPGSGTTTTSSDSAPVDKVYKIKFGGNMGTSGCVSFMFSDVGTVVIENNGADEDKIMEDCFEAGADDFNVEDDVIEISCDPNQVSSVREALEGMGYKVLSAEAEKVPSNYTTIEDEDAIKKMGLLLEHLEDDDDVQNVYHNWENMPVEEEE